MKNDRYASMSQLCSDSQKILIETEARKEERLIELGKLGSLFGEGPNCINNITGLVILICAVAGIGFMAVMIYKQSPDPYSVWEKFSAIITMGLGYLFGVQTCKQDVK